MRKKNPGMTTASSAFIVMFFIGSINAWSVFVTPLERDFGWIRSQTSFTYSLSVATFCIGGILAGQLDKRLSSRRIMRYSSLIVLSGYLLASKMSGPCGLYLFYGVLCGLGIGLCYNSVINVTLKWFPGKQGLISGLLLMGYAVGGAAISSTAPVFLRLFGFGNTFRILGVSMSSIILLGSFLMMPPLKQQPDELTSGSTASKDMPEQFTSTQMIHDPSFLAYYVWAVLLSAVGLSTISNAVPFAESMTSSLTAAALTGGSVSFFNGLGRLASGYIFDKFGSQKCIWLINASFIASSAILILATVTNHFAILALGFFCTGLSYGGIMPVNSALIRKVYGEKNYAKNFGIVTTVSLVAGFAGPYISGLLYGVSGSYLSLALLMLFFGIIAIPCIFFIKRHT